MESEVISMQDDVIGCNALYVIEIINNTREGIIIFFSENKRERDDWGGGKI